MTRTEAIDRIRAKLATLPDERVEALADIAEAWEEPTVYSTLSDAERAEIDAALDVLDRGERLPGEDVFADLRQRIAAAKFEE